jgi:molybdopterin converting factor small subunit
MLSKIKSMKARQTDNLNGIELPLQFSISFGKVFSMYEKYAAEEYAEHPYHHSAKLIIEKFEKFPELIEGFSDFSLLDEHHDKIELLLKPLFPEILQTNEIKAVSIPFSFVSFMFTERFAKILDDAGEDYVLNVRNFEDDLFYIHACTMILGMACGYPVDLKRPFFFDIPDKNGVIKNYRVAFNADMGEIIPTENAPEITEEDYKMLLDNFDNIEVWREKFPPDSYVFRGFGLINLFDVTTDETISSIRNDLLRSDDNLVGDLRKNLAKFYNIDDLMLGFSVFDFSDNVSGEIRMKKSESLIFDKEKKITSNSFFCEGIMNDIFRKKKLFSLSNIEKYGQFTSENPFYKKLSSKGIGSIILVPIQSKSNSDLALLEIASPRAFELNSVNANKLKDIIPVFTSAVERASKEHLNALEATIQEHYTSIHSSVKWKFNEAVEKYHQALHDNEGNVKLEEIIFDNVQPLFGQADIKGSSLARNETIKEDLLTQLNLAKDVLLEALKIEKLPIYNELIFRVNEFITSVQSVLKAGDEVGILEFLKKDIYPTFTHIEAINEQLSEQIKAYMNRLDPELQVVYEKRKSYETSVTYLNDQLTKFIDKGQEEAQNMFPHYFERYKTDGVEHNIYIGQSLVKNKTYDKLYLHNIRLWQLQVMYDMENVARLALNNMEHKLEVASMILVHSNPLAIRFRMDEKQFDVDGAYNIRYAIIKKRIDKAHIKGTDKRITVPGKLSIVYSQEREAVEYRKYLKFLQSKHIFGKIEELELEDLQGVSGLKALRVEINYQEDHEKQSAKAMDQLIKEIQS